MVENLLTGVNIMFGLFGEDKQLINHIVLLGKQVIFQGRHLNVNPSLPLLKAKLKNAYQLEVFIAKQNDAMDTHNEKWKAIILHIQNILIYCVLYFIHSLIHFFIYFLYSFVTSFLFFFLCI